MKKTLIIALVALLVLAGLATACKQEPTDYDLEQDEGLALVALQMRYLAEYFPGLVVDVGSEPEGVQRAIERIGILDQSGYGFTGYNGSDIKLYSDEAATLSVDIDGSQGMVHLAVPTAVGTATPVVLVDSKGGLSNPIEVRKNATPVFYVDADGNVTYTGITSAGGLVGAAVGVRAPTDVGTATPAFFADSTGGQSNPFEIRYSNTPVVVVNSDGDLTAVDGTFSGNIAVTGTSDLAGNVSDSGGALTIADNTLIDGAADAVQLTVQGYTTQTNNSLVVEQSDGTDVFTIDNTGNVVAAGDLQILSNVVAKTGVDVTLSTAEVSGGVISDIGDTAGITITLPAAVAGYHVRIINYTGNDMIIDCDGSDQIFSLTNAAGDSITNTTAYDFVELVALSDAGWVPLSKTGTWSDGN